MSHGHTGTVAVDAETMAAAVTMMESVENFEVRLQFRSVKYKIA